LPPIGLRPVKKDFRSNTIIGYLQWSVEIRNQKSEEVLVNEEKLGSSFWYVCNRSQDSGKLQVEVISFIEIWCKSKGKITKEETRSHLQKYTSFKKHYRMVFYHKHSFFRPNPKLNYSRYSWKRHAMQQIEDPPKSSSNYGFSFQNKNSQKRPVIINKGRFY